MLEITREQIETVRTDPFLASAVSSRLVDPSLAQKPADSLSIDDWDNLHDACLDALTNEAPEVESFDAEQGKSIYSVKILGVPGAYFIFAIEFEIVGVFSTLDRARCEAVSVHGEFRVQKCEEDDEEEDWEEPDPRDPAFPDSLLEILAGTGDSTAIEAMRSTIEGDGDLVMLANGLAAPEDMRPRDEVKEFVVAFEKTLPKPQGTIDGMARGYRYLPRLQLRVELFLRLNGRLPSPGETARLFKIQ